MKYIEMKIKVNKDLLDLLQAELAGEGFTDLLIDDPEDADDILMHPDIYKYDYINEDIGADPLRKPEITLFFTDDEEGRADCGRAENAVRRFGIRYAGNSGKEYAGSIGKGNAGSSCGEYNGDSCELSAEASDPEGSGSGIEVSVSTTGDDSEWLYKWQENFKPAKVGSRIVVKPGWEDYEPAEGELVIEMDPGMAFGSGLHETTSMCIKALEKYMTEGAKVLDVGTGTGILAIAAALLGAADCLGIDIDSEAVRVASENTARNGVGDTVAIAPGDLMSGIDFDADIIAANLMADLVIRLSPAAAAQLKSGGIYITSGILDIKEAVVSEAIREAGFEILEVFSDGEWRAIAARRVQRPPE